jgi:hypothetical protein
MPSILQAEAYKTTTRNQVSMPVAIRSTLQGFIRQILRVCPATFGGIHPFRFSPLGPTAFLTVSICHRSYHNQMISDRSSSQKNKRKIPLTVKMVQPTGSDDDEWEYEYHETETEVQLHPPSDALPVIRKAIPPPSSSPFI